MKSQTKKNLLILTASISVLFFISGCCKKQNEKIKMLETENGQLKMMCDSLNDVSVNCCRGEVGMPDCLTETDSASARKMVKDYKLPLNWNERFNGVSLYYECAKFFNIKFKSHLHISFGVNSEGHSVYVVSVYGKDKMWHYFVDDLTCEDAKSGLASRPGSDSDTLKPPCPPCTTCPPCPLAPCSCCGCG